MRIVVIADPHIPVPPVKYGGTERIVSLLCSEAAKEGHEVQLVAGWGSKNYGGGLWTHRAPTRSYASRAFRKAYFCVRSLLLALNADAIVNFGRADYLLGVLRTRVPLVSVFQNPVRQSEVNFFLRYRDRNLAMVFISRDQKSCLVGVDDQLVIYNAVATDFFTPDVMARKRHGDYLFFLGRLTPNKGVHLAIETARRAGMRLVIAGNIPAEPDAKEYFDRQIYPHLGAGCEWVGEVNDQQKRTLLRGARALLFPIQWREPFGIVMAESLACGTPVIAMRNGSVPEVVRHGRTGFVCDSLDDMVAAVHSLPSISREICREDAVNRFSPAAYLQNMLKACERAGAISGV